MRFLIIFLLLITSCTAVRFPKDLSEKKKKCKDLKALDDLMVAHAFTNNGSVLVQLHPKKVAEQIFDHKKDGIIVEIVRREQFACGTETQGYDAAKWHRPLYKKDIFENAVSNPLIEDAFMFPYGPAPTELKNINYEFNLVYLQKRYFCKRSTVKNMSPNNLGLLETGLFPVELSADSLRKIAEKGMTSEFIIHFEKGKSHVDAEQLQLLLKEIKHIEGIQQFTVTGYASIDGDREVNRRVFQGRTDHIRKEIAVTFPGIPILTDAAENWQDFLTDIENTRYRFLASRNKSTIKRMMKEHGLAEELEPMLESHRKVVISVKTGLNTYNWGEQAFRRHYRSAYQEADLARLLFLQQQVMRKIRNYELPDAFAEELNVPMESKYGAVIQNQLINLFELKFRDLIQTHDGMQELHKLMPSDPHIMYNLTALKLMLLTTRPAKVNRKELERLMHRINKVKLSKILRQRLKVNYNLIKTSEEFSRGNLKEVNKLLAGIRHFYRGAGYSEAELLRLSNYFMDYGHEKYAEEALYPVVKEGTSNQDLIFFYLSLTLDNPKFNKDPWFQALMAQANEMDNARFCTMFKNSRAGGLTFQLLILPELKKRYCKWCE